MPDSENENLHELVRQAVARRQHAYKEQHWEALRQKLPSRRRNRRPIWFGIGLLVSLTGLLTWYFAMNAARQAINPPQIVKPPVKPLGKSPDHGSGQRAIATYTDRKNMSKPPLLRPYAAERAVAGAMRTPHARRLILPRAVKPPGFREMPFVQMEAPIEREIRRRVEQHIIGPDSTTSRALTRNQNRWRNVVIVCDFTSSMYPHATELFAWLAANRRNRYIKGAVFFTDCDSLGRETQFGSTGQFYTVKDWRNTDILPVFIAAFRNTQGNKTIPENDLEAVLHAQRIFPDAQSFVLIADNTSPVKDMHLLAHINKPVRIILCGNVFDPRIAIQPDYLKIAIRTNGSLHTLQEDMPQPNRIKRGTWLHVGANVYRYRRGRFLLRKMGQQ